jgi:uncharacterized RDD family membrane protein YckC
VSEFLHIAKRPGLLRILAAIFYDLWLIAALVLLGTIVDTFLRQALTGNGSGGNHLLLQVWWLVSPWVFFSWFWTHGGQTLGMRAWRIRVVNAEGQPIDWKRATLRYLAAALSWTAAGLGFLWVWFDGQGSSWHDRLSGTYLVMTEKRGKESQPDEG